MTQAAAPVGISPLERGKEEVVMDSAVEMGGTFSAGKLQVRTGTWINNGIAGDGARPEFSERLAVVTLEEIAGRLYGLEGATCCFHWQQFSPTRQGVE